MSGPEFERVLGRHRTLANGPSDCVCSCDLTWRANADYRAHLSAALHAELERWLGDEGTRDRVGAAISGCRLPFDCGSHRTLATAALAALTTTDQEDR